MPRSAPIFVHADRKDRERITGLPPAKLAADSSERQAFFTPSLARNSRNEWSPAGLTDAAQRARVRERMPSFSVGGSRSTSSGCFAPPDIADERHHHLFADGYGGLVTCAKGCWRAGKRHGFGDRPEACRCHRTNRLSPFAAIGARIRRSSSLRQCTLAAEGESRHQENACAGSGN